MRKPFSKYKALADMIGNSFMDQFNLKRREVTRNMKFRFRFFVVSSMHRLQNVCGQVFKNTDLSLSVPHEHIIFLLYSSSST